MIKKTYQFSKKKTTFYFDATFSNLEKLTENRHTIIVTDENVFKHHKKKLSNWKTIVLKAGEISKVQSTINSLIQQLIATGADRQSLLIGVGGGVITDITGYAASIYMRGIHFGFIPTTILAMVDAAIGGKNGIDVGVYKNIVGTINQPEFILYDSSLLKTLPHHEWINGFAEIIKHSCIKDSTIFQQLTQHKISDYKRNTSLINALIRQNAIIKAEMVQKDEFEQNERRLLNFGHTLGHAIENACGLSHGKAVAIGMSAACTLSELLADFKDTARVIALIKQYHLPTTIVFDKEEIFKILKMDKKREGTTMNYVLLEKIGKGIIKNIPLDQVSKFINQL